MRWQLTANPGHKEAYRVAGYARQRRRRVSAPELLCGATFSRTAPAGRRKTMAMPVIVTLIRLQHNIGQRASRGMSMRPRCSADEAVRPVRILQEVPGVAARISAAMLRQEYAVGMVRPTGTSLPDVIGAEARRKVSAGYCAANVFDEPAPSAECGIHVPVAQPHARDRSVGGMSRW